MHPRSSGPRTVGTVKVFHQVEEDATIYPAPEWVPRALAAFVDLTLQASMLALVKAPFAGLLVHLQQGYITSRAETLAWILAALSTLAVTVIPMARTGQTPGKRAFGLRVVTAKEALPPTLVHALLREGLGKWVASGTMFIGFAIAVVTPNRRGAHEYVSGTRLIDYRATD